MPASPIFFVVVIQNFSFHILMLFLATVSIFRAIMILFIVLTLAGKHYIRKSSYRHYIEQRCLSNTASGSMASMRGKVLASSGRQ